MYTEARKEKFTPELILGYSDVSIDVGQYILFRAVGAPYLVHLAQKL